LLIGQVAVPAADLPRQLNVRLIGKRPYALLPAYGKVFDAAIIPYRAGPWSHHANPLKLREYLAMGKPVVAVDTPQTRQFADIVDVAATREEFLQKLDVAVSRPPSAAEIDRRVQRVAGESWAGRSKRMLGGTVEPDTRCVGRFVDGQKTVTRFQTVRRPRPRAFNS
jgi:hypothetical protein